MNPADAGKYALLLKDAGFKVAHHELNAGHNLTQQDITLAADWYRTNFS